MPVLMAAICTLALSYPAMGMDNKVVIQIKGAKRCILSNGIPDHATGRFPRRGNPHSIKTQNINFCVPARPKIGNAPKQAQTIGIALNGVIIRPGTADWYDKSARRGHSRNQSSGWNLDGIGARTLLGIDQQNAHVDKNGIYHYHAMPPALIKRGAHLIGYAADGFEIHYIGNKARASYRLKTGTRPSAPGGKYDGTYNQDWEYKPGFGTLDACNGMVVNGQYTYFATDSYPFFPRCLMGAEITAFSKRKKR